MSSASLLDVRARIPAPLDPEFTPAVLANRNYRKAVEREKAPTATMAMALERESGLVCRSDLRVLGMGGSRDEDTLRVVERHVKSLLWAHGGWRLLLSGPSAICDHVRGIYSTGGRRAFDMDLMSGVYDRPFTVEVVSADEMPAAREGRSAIGGHLEGCRIGFDLGASDYKLAAVIDGKPVFSEEIPWTPSTQKDPEYHYRHITDGLKQAAAKLPRVDAIGGSSAGIYVENEVKVASLFRSVPRNEFKRRVMPMFVNIQKEWNVPLVVVNDGDVTALAGAMSLNKHAMLGIAMGSSEAAGYLDPKGRITGALNELAFFPVDFNPAAVADEWSGDIGVGALYFSQQAVNKLAPAAGMTFPGDMPLPERLKGVQGKADAGDAAAAWIFETIGVYLGYGLAHYADYYDFENVLILGRVTSGRGGEIILDKAREVMSVEFPELAGKMAVHVPDEQSRRVGQAVAAASLPELRG